MKEVKPLDVDGSVNIKYKIMPDKKKLKKIVGELKNASKMHASQADRIDSMLKKSSPALLKLSASCKAAAKRKFKVYPSAYANMWASKTQKKGKC